MRLRQVVQELQIGGAGSRDLADRYFSVFSGIFGNL
jgi:hypothetical protein